MRRRVLVKYGGATLADPALRAKLASDLAEVAAAGVELMVVHGGGPQTTALARRLGLEPRMVGGRRVTDEATLEVAAWSMVGGVGSTWLAALLAAGLRAVATPVASGGLLRATRRPPRLLPTGELLDFGEVADPAGVDPALAVALWAGGFVPVVAPLCVDDAGRRLNLNADTAARALAEGLGVDDVVSVADVPGVFADLADPASHLPELDRAAVAELIASGAVAGGMVAKLEELTRLLDVGVRRCWIVGALEPWPVSAALRGRPGRRTCVRAESP
jgi:acetylglutamate kinase